MRSVTNGNEPTPLTTAQLAERLGVSPQRIRQWVEGGRLAPLYPGLRPWLFAANTRRPKARRPGRRGIS